MPYSYDTPNKNDGYLSKSHKVHNQSREGDWVCLNCNNLNFSFRKKCNRCKTQTRKDNEHLQQAYSYYFYQEPYNQYAFSQQNLSDGYSQQEQIQTKNMHINQNTQIKQIENTQDIVISLNQTPVKMIKNFTPFKEIQNVSNSLKMSKKDKLSTPNSKKKCKNNKQNNILDLPSVSPLLKKYQAHQMETACDNSLPVLFSNDLWGSHIKVVNFNVEQMQNKNKCSNSSGKKGYYNFWQQQGTQNEQDKISNLIQQPTNEDDDFDLSEIINKIMI